MCWHARELRQSRMHEHCRSGSMQLTVLHKTSERQSTVWMGTNFSVTISQQRRFFSVDLVYKPGFSVRLGVCLEQLLTLLLWQHAIDTIMLVTLVEASMVRGMRLLRRAGHARVREGTAASAWKRPSHARRRTAVWNFSAAYEHAPERQCATWCAQSVGGSSPPIDVLVMVEATAKQVKCGASNNQL